MSDRRHDTRPYVDDNTPVGGMSTEYVRELARSEAESEGRRQQQKCVEEGPICTVWEEIRTMRTDIGSLKMEQTKMLAVLGFWKWALPVVVAIVGIAVGLLAPRVIPQIQSVHSPQIMEIRK
jgi:hypothetical protein